MRGLGQRLEGHLHGEEEGPPARAVGWHPLGIRSVPSLPCLGSLRPLDMEFLQRLCRTVNVVPVIARADSLTIEEREAFRRRVIWAPGARLGLAGLGRAGSVYRVGRYHRDMVCRSSTT